MKIKSIFQLFLLVTLIKRLNSSRILINTFPNQPNVAPNPTFSFFMHDVMGGTTPSERIVSGVVSTKPKPTLPFLKKKNGIFPLNGGTPLNDMTLPLIFGTITVFDDQLTQGQELGGSVIGKAQGFYLATSVDGSSHTMAFTALFGEREDDTVSFFGVHRTATRVSRVAIVGGTGKYENAQGYATVETLRLTDQHLTDGVDALLRVVVYVSH